MLLEVPRFHKDAFIIGFKNFYRLKKIYSEIIGIGNIDHFSINIESSERELAFLSCNPAVALTLIDSGLFPYDGSVSPTVYRNKSIYQWDKNYFPKYVEKIKEIKEYKFGIDKGVVLVHKVNNFHIMYSFASKKNGSALIEEILEDQTKYLEMGKHCYQLIRPIYSRHLVNQNAPIIGELCK